MKRIICIGNRWIEADAAGPKVYDILIQQEMLPEVEIIDGGLAGLDLLPLLINGQRIVMVDAIQGIRTKDGVAVLNEAELLAASSEPESYGHDAGLAFLLRMRPEVYPETVLPEIMLVGVEWSNCLQTDELHRAAAIAMQVVLNGERWQGSTF